MATIHLCSALPSPDDDPSVPDYAHDDLRRLRRFAGLDRFGAHTLTDDPATADLILFVERAHAPGSYMQANRRHPYAHDYPNKTFVVNGRYYGVPFLPGVYGSVRTVDVRFPNRVRSAAYLEVCDFDHLTYDANVSDRPYLFSFVGAIETWPEARRPLLGLSGHPRGLIRDTSAQRHRLEEELGTFNVDSYHQQYVELCHDTKFVLCPRGDAVSSMRLFEALRLGRAPVIISDHWLPPEGPDWDAFSVRVAQDEIDALPARLEALEPEAEAMGHRARAAWDDWFAADAIFHRTVEWCLDMKARRRLPESVSRPLSGVSMLNAFHLRRYAGEKTRSLRRAVGLSRSTS